MLDEIIDLCRNLIIARASYSLINLPSSMRVYLVEWKHRCESVSIYFRENIDTRSVWGYPYQVGILDNCRNFRQSLNSTQQLHLWSPIVPFSYLSWFLADRMWLMWYSCNLYANKLQAQKQWWSVRQNVTRMSRCHLTFMQAQFLYIKMSNEGFCV